MCGQGRRRNARYAPYRWRKQPFWSRSSLPNTEPPCPTEERRQVRARRASLPSRTSSPQRPGLYPRSRLSAPSARPPIRRSFCAPGGRQTPAFPRRLKSMARNSMSPPFSIADIWSADSIPCGAWKAPLAWRTRTLITTPIPARRCIRSMTPRGATWKTGSFRRSGAGTARGRSLPVRSFKSPIPCIKE